MDLTHFKSILIFFSEKEIEELQAAIDMRRSKRLAREGEDRSGSAEQSYSPNVGEENFPEVDTREPAQVRSHTMGAPNQI